MSRYHHDDHGQERDLFKAKDKDGCGCQDHNPDRDKDRNKKMDFSDQSTLEGLFFTVIGRDGKMRISTADNYVLASGEIGVVFCAPIFGLPSARLRDIKLNNGQFGRIYCGFTTTDVACVRKQDRNPVETRTLLPGQFVVVTCDCC